MINSSNKCDGCGGTVKNIDGKRSSIPKLTTAHNQTCPGRPTSAHTPKES